MFGFLTKFIAKRDEEGVSGSEALIGFIIAGYIALQVVFALNTAAFDAVTLALWNILGIVIIAAVLRGVTR